MLDKHLIFSVLSSIVAKEENAEAQEMTLNLADFLRFSFEEERSLEPLGRELDGIESYIALQQSHHGDNLLCSVRSSEEARLVPSVPMMIRLLLQNAFKYGLRTSEMPIRVEVNANVERKAGPHGETETLVVRVSNTGRWVDSNPGKEGGGLLILRERLHTLFGEEAVLEIREDPHWVHVEVSIPVDAANRALNIRKGEQ